MSFVNRLFGNEPLFSREQASASLVSAGQPNTAGSYTEDATGATSLSPQVGPAGEKLKLARKTIPPANNIDLTTKFIKQVRSQYQIREVLEEIAGYVVDGFRVKPSGGNTLEVKKFLAGTDLYSKIGRIAFELITVGWCVVYVSEDTKVLPGITIMHNVTVRRGVDGVPHIYMHLSEDAKKAIQANPKAYPKTWQQQLSSPNGIDITRVYDKAGNLKQGGAYYICVEPDGEDVYPVAPLYPALSHIVDTERISDAAGSIIDFLKLYLLQAKLGNELGQDLRDGRIRMISPGRVEDVGKLLSAGYKVGAAVTPGDIRIEHSVPKDNPWEHPYAAADHEMDRAQRITGLPDFDKYASEGTARFMAMRLMPKVDTLRHAIITQKFLLPFLLDMASRFPYMADVRTIWSSAAILDYRTLLDRMKTQLATGGCSIQYLNELLDPDYDFDAAMLQKEYEAKFSDTVGMIWEPTQGISDKQISMTEEQAKNSTEAPKPVAAKKNKSQSPIADTGGRPTN